MTDFRYKTTFASHVSKISGEELDKYISLAGLENLKPLMPKEVNLEQNPDLIGIVLNAAVAGRVNANDDGITIETGVRIAKNFILKFCNSNHARNRVIGVIVNAGFSKFGDSKILTEEEANKSTDPINVSLAVLLWKPVLNDEFIELVENSADPTSADFGALSASWELFFNNYDIYVGGKNISESKKIEDAQEKEEYDKILRCNGGAGKTKDGKRVYRVIRAESEDDMLLPVGIGLVDTPAAEVRGLQIVEAKQLTIKDSTLALLQANSLFIDFIERNKISCEKAINLVRDCAVEQTDGISDLINKMQSVIDKKDKEISLSAKSAVMINESMSKNMKITKLADITNDSLKECQATEITSFIEEKLREANESFVKEQKEKEVLQSEMTVTKAELDKVQKQLTEIKNQIEAKNAEDLFNSRMAFLDETYELSKEDKVIIVAQVQKIATKEEWDAYVSQSQVIMKEKSKAYKAELARENAEKEAKAAKTEVKVSKASEENLEANKTVDNALANGQAANTPPPNAATVEDDFMARFKKAFNKPEDVIEVRK